MTSSGTTLTMRQIEAVERLFPKLKEWQRPLAALEMLAEKVSGFDTSATLLKTVAVNELMATQIYALVAMAAHVQDALDGVDLTKAGPELVDKIADFEHKEKKRACLSFASKFAHFFVDPNRFPMKDKYATKMLKFHLGTRKNTKVSKGSKDTKDTYAAFISGIEELRRRDGLESLSFATLDHYLWFAGKYRASLGKPPFEKRIRKRTVSPKDDGKRTNNSDEKELRAFRKSLEAPEYAEDLLVVLSDSPKVG
jgi:hypothetical protein